MKKAVCIIIAILTLVSTVSLACASGRTYVSYTPYYSPLGTEQIGDILVSYGSNGSRKIVREYANPSARQVDVVYPGYFYPCYGWTVGSNNHVWYYVWIEGDNVWGWVSSACATLCN